MGPCQELFGGVYGNIDTFFNMANCLGLGQPIDITVTNTSSGATTSPSTFTGSTPTNRVQRGLLAGMLAFMLSIA